MEGRKEDALYPRPPSRLPFGYPWLVTQAARLPGRARLGRERPQRPTLDTHAREFGACDPSPSRDHGQAIQSRGSDRTDGRGSAQSPTLTVVEAAPRGRMGSTGVGTGAVRQALQEHALVVIERGL
jgi:hypothetical protein